jgi:rRNA-processing protein FCF1
MRLREGVTAESAGRALSEALRRLENLRGGGTTIEQYLSWVTESEKSLRAVIGEPDLPVKLYSDRYWHIFGSPRIRADLVKAYEHNRWIQALYAEIEAQVEGLQAAARQLHEIKDSATFAGSVIVYDTNSLMHYEAPQDIHWSNIRQPPIRLVIPLVVVDELDRKRYSGSPKMAGRARTAQRALWKVFADEDPSRPAPVPHRDGVSVEILLDEPGHQRLASPDDEIIDRVCLLKQLGTASVAVLTHDIGLALRAKSAGLDIVRLPESSAKPEPKADC